MSDKYVNSSGLEAVWEAVKAFVNKKVPPVQASGDWSYKIYDDNTFEAWYTKQNYNIAVSYASGNLYRSNLTALNLPSDIINNYDVNICHADVGCAHNNYPVFGMVASIGAEGVNFYAMSGAGRSANSNHTLTAYVFGTLTAKA